MTGPPRFTQGANNVLERLLDALLLLVFLFCFARLCYWLCFGQKQPDNDKHDTFWGDF